MSVGIQSFIASPTARQLGERIRHTSGLQGVADDDRRRPTLRRHLSPAAHALLELVDGATAGPSLHEEETHVRTFKAGWTARRSRNVIDHVGEDEEPALSIRPCSREKTRRRVQRPEDVRASAATGEGTTARLTSRSRELGELTNSAIHCTPGRQEPAAKSGVEGPLALWHPREEHEVVIAKGVGTDAQHRQLVARLQSRGDTPDESDRAAEVSERGRIVDESYDRAAAFRG
ncbi:MAG: hypothetical protein FJW96_03235 [Actinobacteria bacterium]|nr:hypothetical protein [Actinomycetota bacterium]